MLGMVQSGIQGHTVGFIGYAASRSSQSMGQRLWLVSCYGHHLDVSMLGSCVATHPLGYVGLKHSPTSCTQKVARWNFQGLGVSIELV